MIDIPGCSERTNFKQIMSYIVILMSFTAISSSIGHGYIYHWHAQFAFLVLTLFLILYNF
jgi:hypothetical protein